MSDSKKPGIGSALPRGLLGRGGNIVGQSTRLPALRSPRDLTLGGVAKRTFAPTIAAAHKPKAPVKDEIVKNEFPSTSGPSTRGRGRGDGDRNRGGRGRGRGRGQLTQLSGGIFAEGVAAAPKKGYEYEAIQPSKTKIAAAVIEKQFKNPAEEEQYVSDQLKLLMCDDFIDDGELDPFADLPTKLPVIQREFEAKEISEWKNITDKIKIKEEASAKIEQAQNTVNIKAEPIDVEDVEMKSPKKAVVKVDTTETCSMTSSTLLTNLCELGKDESMIFRLPDEFSTLLRTNDRPVIKQEPGVGLALENREDIKSSLPQNDVPKQPNLSDLPEGYLGKLQVMKSGRTRLIIGNTILNVELGGPVEFLQHLVSIDAAGNPPSMAILGNNKHALICTPELDKFLISENTS